jgi:hypothetical protein
MKKIVVSCINLGGWARRSFDECKAIYDDAGAAKWTNEAFTSAPSYGDSNPISNCMLQCARGAYFDALTVFSGQTKSNQPPIQTNAPSTICEHSQIEETLTAPQEVNLSRDALIKQPIDRESASDFLFSEIQQYDDEWTGRSSSDTLGGVRGCPGCFARSVAEPLPRSSGRCHPVSPLKGQSQFK